MNELIEKCVTRAGNITEEVYDADIVGMAEAIEDLIKIALEYQDYKEYVRDNYEPSSFNPYHEYGLNESDFH